MRKVFAMYHILTLLGYPPQRAQEIRRDIDRLLPGGMCSDDFAALLLACRRLPPGLKANPEAPPFDPDPVNPIDEHAEQMKLFDGPTNIFWQH